MSVLIIAAVNTGVAYGLIRLSTVAIPLWVMPLYFVASVLIFAIVHGLRRESE